MAVRVAAHSMNMCRKAQQHVYALMEREPDQEDSSIQTIRMKTACKDDVKEQEIIIAPQRDYTMVVFQRQREEVPKKEGEGEEESSGY